MNFLHGPRRSTALAVFQGRVEEGEYAPNRAGSRRARGQAPRGKEAFIATFAKTKTGREISGHCAWIRRVVDTLAPNKMDHLHLECATGGAWIGQSFVASSKTLLPPGLGADEVIYDEEKGRRPWV